MYKTGLKIALGSLSAMALVVPVAGSAQEDTSSWDGLVEVEAKRIDEVYLLPEADFRAYTKVLLDPTEVSFRRNWQRDQRRASNYITDAEAREMLEEARTGFEEIMREAFVSEGYTVVDTPGDDVLRVHTAIVDLDITAPEARTAARTRSYAREAGEATLVVEARDSLSGQLLGRSVDSETAGEFGAYIRNSTTNRADFERLFRQWAEQGAKGLTELREMSPLTDNGANN